MSTTGVYVYIGTKIYTEKQMNMITTICNTNNVELLFLADFFFGWGGGG